MVTDDRTIQSIGLEAFSLPPEEVDMPGKAILKVAPRQDLCIFCALRFGRVRQPPRRHIPGQKRAFQASTWSRQPPAAAYAVAEDEPDESPQSVQQPSPPPPKPSPSAWPTFVPKKPLAKSVEPATRPPENKPTQPEPSNWKCSGCGNINLARRGNCGQCNTPKNGPIPKPQSGPIVIPKGQIQTSQFISAGFSSRSEGFPGERSREGGQRHRPSNFGRSILEVDRGPRVTDEIQKLQPGWGNLFGRSEGSTGERSREAGQSRQPFDFGRSIWQANRNSNPTEQAQKPQPKQGDFLGRSEGTTSEQSERRQQPIEFGRSSVEVGSGRPLWRPRNTDQRDGRGRPLPSQGQEQADRPLFRRIQHQERPKQELDQRGRSTFGGHQPQERREREATAGGGAPLNSAQQHSQSRDKRIDRTGNFDTGNRSGLDALLQHTVDTKNPKPRRVRSAEAEIPMRRLATRDLAPRESTNVREGKTQAQMSRRSNVPDEIMPHFPTVVAEPFVTDGVDYAFRHRKERHRGRFQESEEEGPRTRGRFQADLEEPGVAATKLEPRMERKVSRRASSRQSGHDLGDPDEELLSEGRNRKRKTSKAKSKEVISARIPIQLPEFISVENLATALRVRIEDFITRMEEMGFERPRHDHVLDAETAGLIASEFNFEPMYNQEVQDLVPQPISDDASSLPPRPPIVTIMGHVDHGKTTILDWLRNSAVVESEHGGITQHIGAFSVTMPGGKQITFLDTPGHAAFLDMRRRGANVTDIVILVVAADDSVKPQTLEAIKHATDAKVPIIVAINKVDKEDSNVDRVKQDLARHGVTVEDYGGEVQAIPVSGKFGKGMAELEEATVTLSELLDHRAEVDGPVEGWIIESKVTMAGRVATVLVRRGTLRAGDIIVAGTTWARVRTLRNDAGALVDEAPPGTPVQIDGWRGDDPIAGWQVLQAEDEDHAKDVVDVRQEREEYSKLAGDTTAINAIRAEEAEARARTLAWEAEQEWASKRAGRRPKDNAGWVENRASGGPKEVLFVVKADVSGSVEAIVNSVSAIGNNEIATNVIRSGVGVINESDVQHLASSGEVGYLISFNQPVDASVSRLAEATGVEILDHNIIYKVTDVVKEKLSAELPPTITQRVVGEAEIGKVFDISVKKGKVKVAGCKISNGVISRDKKIRVLRGTRVVYDGTLNSLKNVKKDVSEMRKGSECGIGFENWEDFQEGDQIQSYEEQKTARTL